MLMMPRSDLYEAFPTILFGVGVAYAVGVASGALIFSPPSVYIR